MHRANLGVHRALTVTVWTNLCVKPRLREPLRWLKLPGMDGRHNGRKR